MHLLTVVGDSLFSGGSAIGTIINSGGDQHVVSGGNVTRHQLTTVRVSLPQARLRQGYFC